MNEEQLKAAKLLIVDDEQFNLQLSEAVLREAGYTRITATSDSRQALPLFLDCKPDLLMLDLRMPHLDGFAVMRQLTPRIPAADYFPILVITAELTPEVKHEALAEGAKDFLTKPIDPTEVQLRVQNMLTTRFLHRELRVHSERLEEQVHHRTRELEEAQMEILQRLALAAEYRDDATGLHTWRVGQVAAMVAQDLGWLPDQVELIRRAAPLHDVGKIGIPDRILMKNDEFTPKDYEEMKSHVTMGSKILSGSRSRLLQLAEVIALTHHEHWDGSGYMSLKGEKIPPAGRIVTVADVFDALTHTRRYKESWPIGRARAEIAGQAGKQFDPQVVEVFLKLIDREAERLLFKSGREEVLF